MSIANTMNKIGSFEVNSGEIVCSDPCYTNEHNMGVVNVLNGKYNVFAEYSEDQRISTLIVCHERAGELYGLIPFGSYGVDSGQFGFFDSDKYNGVEGIGNKLDESWYDNICNITGSDKMAGIVNSCGCVSSSGYGDGEYEVSTKKINGVVVALQVVFIDEEDEENEEESCWDCGCYEPYCECDEDED